MEGPSFHDGSNTDVLWHGENQGKMGVMLLGETPDGFQGGARLSRPIPNSPWIDVPFTFVTKQEEGLTGNCSGTISFVPSQEGPGWKIGSAEHDLYIA